MSVIPDIFGVDLAGQLNSAFTGLVFPVTLNKVTTTRSSTNITEVTKTRTPHTGQGFTEDKVVTNRSGNTLIRETTRVVSIFGKSLPAGISPEPGDEITINGSTSTIVPGGVSRDPAGALFTCVTK